MKAVLLEGIHPRAEGVLTHAGFDVQADAASLTGDDLAQAIADATVIGIRSKTKLTSDIIAQANNLWAIGCFCIGTDQVDLGAARERGITVFNAPFSNTRSVAEKTICEIIALHRRLFDRSSQMHAGQWVKSAQGAREVRGKTLGIVGYGRIGSQVSVLAEAMGMIVRYYDTLDVLPLGNAMAAASLDELFAESDIITVHVPDTPQTRGMIGPDELAKMKKGAYFLNNARGKVCDIDALAAALRSGALAGAAVDVFPAEPKSNNEPFDSPLRGIENVILTPHIAGSTLEAQENIAIEVSSKLAKLMHNGSTTTAVNVPEVDLPRLHADDHRVLHYHRNVPGVLGKINAAVSEQGVNISAQYLQSDAEYSYMIMDVHADSSEPLAEGLRAIDETIRVRAIW